MECPTPIYLRKTNLFVPCGRCGACLKRKISDYSLRCQVEMRHSVRSYFVTLTYEIDPLQVYKKDLQSFFKRLRKVGFQFSYFAVADYGDTYGRPHYHVLFFVKGFFIPEYLWSLWVSGDQTRKRGFVHIRPMSIGRIAYVVRYGYLAKVDWDKSDKRTKPFFLMSRRPALGLNYLTDAAKKFHKRGDRWYFPDHGYKKSLPRYYRDKLFNKAIRALHSDTFSLEKIERRDAVLRQLSNDPQKAISIYYDRMQEASFLYLDGLRKQKLLKNKSL